MADLAERLLTEAREQAESLTETIAGGVCDRSKNDHCWTFISSCCRSYTTPWLGYEEDCYNRTREEGDLGNYINSVGKS